MLQSSIYQLLNHFSIEASNYYESIIKDFILSQNKYDR